MRSFVHVIVADQKIGEEWFNAEPRRFAVPLLHGETAAELVAGEVERLVGRYLKSSSAKEKSEIMAILIVMHAQRKVLWPIGALFDHSALGIVGARRTLRDDLAANGGDLLVLLDELQNDLTGPFGSHPVVERRTYGLSTWKSLISLRLATTKPLSTLRTYDHDTFEAFARVARPSGEWAAWFPYRSRVGVRFAVRFLAEASSDPHFGASIVGMAKLTQTGRRSVDPFMACPHLKWLDTLYEQWLDETRVLMKRGPRSGKLLLGDFFSTLPVENTSRVESAFNVKDMRALLLFARTWSTPARRVAAVGKVREFIEYLEREHTSGHITVSGPMQLGLERHQVEQFGKSVHVPRRPSLSGEVQARPMPTRYHQRLKEIITENDFAWPKSLLDARNGRPAQWITWRDPETGMSSQVFCPVLARLLLLQLDLPLRNVQARRLDSGEGDVERWNRQTGKWEPNAGPHGGRWERIGAGNPRRGAIRSISAGDGKVVTGIWVNSNKTQDRNVTFDDTAGYEIPWEHPEVLQNLAAMRDWQEQYNPVAGPLPHAELPASIFQDEPSAPVRALIPDRFYLFRYPLNLGPRGPESPPTYFVFLQFFNDALEELQRRLNEENPERPVTIITGRDRSGAPNKAVYTIHGMRSSTLTGLHLAGVPVEILSKVVAGHASILMTLNYLKFDPLHVSQVLTDARLKAASEAKEHFPDLLRKANFENAIKLTARLSEDGIGQMKGAYAEPSNWLRLDIGLCPNNATQCRIGGEAIQRRSNKGIDKSVYAAVPGGERNCVRCRFFVTGLPFLIPLWAHGSSIMARADALAKQAAARDDESRRLKQNRKDLRAKGELVPRELSHRIELTEELHVSDCDRRDQALADLHHTLALIEKVRAIGRQASVSGDGSLPMLLPDDGIPELMGREGTRFELVDAVVQQSRWFPSLESADIERERDEFLSRILYRNGYVPITISPLAQSERQQAADAMAKFLLLELGASEVEHLATGRKSLDELGLQDGLEAACRRAVGRPLHRIEMRPPIEALAVHSHAVVGTPKPSMAPQSQHEDWTEAKT